MSLPQHIIELRGLLASASGESVRKLDRCTALLSGYSKDRKQREFLELQVLQSHLLKKFSLHSNRRDDEKNRYKDVLPYEQSRVILGGGAYINASEIRDDPSRFGEIGALPSLLSASSTLPSSSASYIACQGPLKHTTEDFWDMIIEKGVQDMIMLTGLVESGREKCYNYFADGAKFGKYRIRCIRRESVGDVEVRDMEVRQGSISHRVRHHHLMMWPDHGVPPSPELLDPLLDVMYHNAKAGRTTVVHCSAGIGRSGVLIAVSILIMRIHATISHGIADNEALVDEASFDEKGNEVDNHPDVEDHDRLCCSFVDIVGSMRRQRAGMVQTLAQFGFCIDAAMRLTSLLEVSGNHGLAANSDSQAVTPHP